MATLFTKNNFPIVHAAWVLAIAGLLASGCVREPGYGEDTDLGTANTTVALTYALSDSPDQENEINTVDVLVFRNGVYRNHINRTGTAEITDAGTAVKKISLTLEKGTGYELVMLCNVVNPEGYANVAAWLAAHNAYTTKAEVLGNLVFTDFNGFEQAVCAYGTTTTGGTFPGFPMWGETAVVTISEYTLLTVPVIRSVARIDIVNKATDFKIAQAYLYNYSTRGLVAPYADKWNATATPPVTGISLPTGIATDDYNPGTVAFQDGHCTYLQWETSNDKFIRTIYALEAEKTKGADITQWLAGTAIVIGGRYNDGPITYYRIDLEDKNGNYMQLLRNHKYALTINEVREPGFETPDLGFRSANVSLSYTVTQWSDSPVDGDDNWHYSLSVSESEIALSKEETLSGIYVDAKHIGTSAGKHTKVKVEVTKGSDWIKLTDGSGSELSAPSATEFTASAVKIFNYRTRANTDNAPRTGVITLTWGNITKTIDITQHAYSYSVDKISDPSNCYMVQPSGIAVKFPINATIDGVIRSGVSTGLSGTLTTGFVWTGCVYGLSNRSVVHRILIDGSTVSANLIVIPGPATGNALISVTNNPSGSSDWSWHIWNTDYIPEPTGSPLIFMDRNLGALSNSAGLQSFGLLYQWGRKDPFPGSATLTMNSPNGEEPAIYNASGGSATITKKNVAVSNNLANAIANPNIYYLKETSPYDWYSSTNVRNNNLWGKTKTVYDPCPAGWKVPGDVWSGLTTANFVWSGYGRTRASVGGWYPAAGSRDYYRDMFFGVSQYGYYWTTLVDGSDGVNLRFEGSNVSPTSRAERASGFSIRCVLK